MGALALCLPVMAAAVAVTVRVEVPPEFEQRPAEVELVVTPVAGAGEFPPAVRQLLPGAAPWEGRLRPGFTYRVEVSAPGWWAAPAMLRPEDAALPVVVPLWPTAELTLPWAGGAPPPASLEVGFTATGLLGPGVLATHRVACQAKGEAWACPVPVFVRDVRLAWPGSAPLYLFDLALPPHQQWRLPHPLPHRPGGSVSGWVVGEGALDDVKVQLLPPPPAPEGDGSPPAPRGKPSPAVPCTRRGFFQLTGLEAGAYLLGAGGAERRAVPRWLEVGGDGETLLTEGVAVGKPVPVTVELTPVTHPGGSPWRVAARPTDAPWDGFPGGFGARPGATAGQHVFPGLAPGRWEVVVAGQGDMAWLRHQVEVHAGMESLRLEVPTLAVEGTVRRGASPWRGDLQWSDALLRLVRVATDEEGRFSCTLPGPGEYQVVLRGEEQALLRRVVTVPPAPPGGVAEVEILLPALEIVGEVVDESGEGVPGAAVTVKQAVAGGEITQQTLVAGPRGHFAIPAAPGEELVFWAVHGHTRSSQVSIVAPHRQEQPVRLVLRRQREIRGRVRSPLGAAAGVGLRVVPWTPDAATALRALSATTDGEGRFAVEVPADTVEAALAAWLPGFGLALAGWRPEQEGEVLLAASAQPGRLRLPAPRRGTPWELRWEGVRLPGFAFVGWGREGSDATLELEAPAALYALCAMPHPQAWRPGPGLPVPCSQGVLPPGGELTLPLPEAAVAP